MNSKNILVTGGSGFIGFYLIKALLDRTEHHVFCFSRKKELPEKFKSLPFQKRLHLITGDLTRRADIFKAIAMERIDLVLHLAASVSSHNFKENEQVNVQGTQYLTEACKENGVQKIIFTSSFTVMEPETSNYGETKRLTEEVLQRGGIPFTILRLAMVYGHGGKGFTKFVRNVQKFPGVIPLIGKGNYHRQPVYVEDVVEIIVKCMEEKMTTNKIYYLGGPEALSFREMMSIIAQELGVQKKFLPLPLALLKNLGALAEKILPNSPITKRDITSIAQEVVFDTSLAEKELGFQPRTFREGVRMALKEK